MVQFGRGCQRWGVRYRELSIWETKKNKIYKFSEARKKEDYQAKKPQSVYHIFCSEPLVNCASLSRAEVWMQKMSVNHWEKFEDRTKASTHQRQPTLQDRGRNRNALHFKMPELGMQSSIQQTPENLSRFH